jgi:hypothetical protein
MKSINNSEMSDQEDFDYFIQRLTGFREYIEREKQMYQDYEDESKLARTNAVERNFVARMLTKEYKDNQVYNEFKWPF